MSNSDDEGVDSGSNPTPDDWMHITKPGPHDVLCGRGGGTNNHPGNVKFRQTINDHKLRYLAASKVEKPKVAREVVKIWRALDPPGRFLARKDDTKRGPGSVKAEGNVWYDVGDKKAREKASQCLRERTPDVLPYVREMQRRQDLLTGQGLRMVEQQMRMRHEGQAMQSQVNGMNGINGMNGLNGAYPAAVAAGGHPMSEPDINNAFSVEHFFTHGFHNTGANGFGGSTNPDDPLSFQQMSQDQQRWDQAGFPSGMPPPNQVFSANNPDLDPVPLHAANQDSFVVSVKPDAVGSSGMPPEQPTFGDDELTLEEYMESMKEFKAYHLDEEQKGKSRTNELLGMQANSWVRSFHSVDKSEGPSVNDAPGHHDSPKRKARKKQPTKLDVALSHDQSKLAKQQSTRTHLSAATQKSAMSTMSAKSAQSAMSGISMFSEFSEQSRNSKMSQARGMASSLSMMSDFTDITDLSGTLSKIDLEAGASTAS